MSRSESQGSGRNQMCVFLPLPHPVELITQPSSLLFFPQLHVILGNFGCLIVERSGSDVWAFLLSHDILYHHRFVALFSLSRSHLPTFSVLTSFFGFRSVLSRKNIIVVKQLIYNDISSTKVRLFVRRRMSIKSVASPLSFLLFLDSSALTDTFSPLAHLQVSPSELGHPLHHGATALSVHVRFLFSSLPPSLSSLPPLTDASPLLFARFLSEPLPLPSLSKSHPHLLLPLRHNLPLLLLLRSKEMPKSSTSLVKARSCRMGGARPSTPQPSLDRRVSSCFLLHLGREEGGRSRSARVRLRDETRRPPSPFVFLPHLAFPLYHLFDIPLISLF